MYTRISPIVGRLGSGVRPGCLDGQELIKDDEIRAALAAIRSALTDDGRFVFETRNPLVRVWEYSATDYTAEVTDAGGALVRCRSQAWTPVEHGIVRGAGTYTSPGWDRPQGNWGMPRFLDAGPTNEEQFGDWVGQSLTAASPKIIIIARKG